MTDNKAKELLITARIGLLLKHPFFGNVASSLQLVNADEWCPTAATDGVNFYYNSDFIVNKLKSQGEREFLFGHEILHVIYEHLSRMKDHDKMLSNIAQDYAVNLDLSDAKVGTVITSVPCLLDERFRGMSWEEIYDLLKKEACSNANILGSSSSIEKLAGKMLDQHLDGKENADDDNKDGKSPPTISKNQLKETEEKIKSIVINASQAAGAGNLPANLQRIIKELTEPKINWKDLLAQQIQSLFKNNYSWMKPGRKSWHGDAIMPSLTPGEKIDICVAIDVSGSITDDDIKVFLSEIKGIVDAYNDYQISMMCWDTEVHNFKIYTTDSTENILEYKIQGGGGTQPDCIWDFLKVQGIEPKKLVVFTDYCFYSFDSGSAEDYCNTVWIIKNNPKAKPKFGVYAIYEDALKQ